MSSRKMSLSGWRPAVVTGWSSTKRDPGVGAALDHEHPGAGGDVVAVERDVVVGRVDRRGRPGGTMIGVLLPVVLERTRRRTSRSSRQRVAVPAVVADDALSQSTTPQLSTSAR